MAEISIADEYRGPPVAYAVPRAFPIEIASIPVATPAAAVPVVHPLPSPARKLALGSPTSVIAFDALVASSGEVGSSGALECAPAPVEALCEIESSGEFGTLIASSGEVGTLIASSGEFGTLIASSGEVGTLIASSGEVGSGSASSGALSHGTDTDAFGDSGTIADTAPERRSTDSALTSDFDDCEESADRRRRALVTFEDSPSPDVRAEETEPGVRKGACYRCLKGGRFTDKEVCLVCDAKYCGGCVLRAMGSMPEGRKCVGCMGFPIEEPKRERLGKSSRLLRRLLSSLEVQQVLKAEKECEANQLRPEYVSVNGKKLGQEEMVLLQSCGCPPSKLKPGHYWYDKVAGFWGKEGQKPHQIISPHLNVGGGINRNASNGNTGILINGREITKPELRMLKWAGVQCAGSPHFWVNADGTYQEEGQKNIKGELWGKTTSKLLCSLLSLPVPSKATNPLGEEVNTMINRVMPDYLEKKTLQKILLVGCHGSGTSTIFKQAKFLYRSNPFSDDERQSIKVMIHSNIYTYLGILLEGRERFEEESLLEKSRTRAFHSSDTSETASNDVSDECADVTEYSISPRLRTFSDWLLKVMASGDLEAIFPAATREYAPKVEELWNNPAIQATYRRRSELPSLPSGANYFLERVVDISRADYEPTDLDILYADGITSTNGVACTDFHFPHSASNGNNTDGDDQQDTLLRYQLIRVHTKSLGENCKWLDMFEDVRMVVFCVALSDYDVWYEDAKGVLVNKMMESKKLFESIISHPSFYEMSFFVILNKYDLLEQKIESSPLTLCEWFGDFNPVLSSHRQNNSSRARSSTSGSTLAQMAFYYIAVKFKQLYSSFTGRKLYVASASGLDLDSVDAALRYAREVLKWEDETPMLVNSEYSDTDPNTYSE